MAPTVFLDTNILHFAIQTVNVLIPHPTTVQWGPRTITVDVHHEAEIIRTSKLTGVLKQEVALLAQIAELAKCDRVILLCHNETLWESFKLPRKGIPAHQRFWGAEIQFMDAPIRYSRPLTSTLSERRRDRNHDPQYEFMCEIQHPRFVQLQRATGALQGNKPKAKNQLLDAFHLWVAEYAGADYFLTCDFKLIKLLSQVGSFTTSVNLVRPSELICAIVAKPPGATH